MGNQTQLTQSELDAVAKKHTDVAQQVSSSQKNLKNSIQTLASSNHGDMMKSLERVHESWQKSCSDIVKNLETMADQVKKSGQQYGDQDSQLASKMNKVETPGLQGFMGN